jgi:GNAT superfamily N-acetyltransferase
VHPSAFALRKATPSDRDLLVELMAEFYAEAGYPLNQQRACTAFSNLLDDEHFGFVWLIHADSQDVGYVVMTLGYSMEYGGRDAFIDDLFVRSAHRGRGLGTKAITALRATCETMGVRALHLEVGRDNVAAQSIYRQAGFVDTDRQLLTLRLADPTHVP